MNPGKDSLYSTKYFFVIVFLALSISISNAQSIWKEASFNKNFYSGIAIASADVNGDAIDDLLVLDQSKHLWLGVNNGFAHFYWTALPFHQTAPAWSINIADIDQNGYNDIIISGEGIQVSILYQDKSGFQLAIIDGSNIFSQAACIFDINQDGWLDFTLTDDDAVTRIYLNNGSGILIRDTTLIDLNLPDRSKNAGNYGCIWTDFDWDGHPDLYISKCFPGVDDTSDLRRINLFYVKNGNGWPEQGVKKNVNLNDQSWISVFEDFDNDGLPDLFVINHYTPCRLLKQRPDHVFEDYTQQSGLDYSGIGLQAMAFDFDNDGDIDILVTGTSTELWLNDGSMHFTKATINLSENPFSSCVAGDFNSDGFLDLYVSYASLLNAPVNQKDKVWLNPGNQNHYIVFNFYGIQSNKNGIGAKIKVYTGTKIQIRELHAGECYGIQNSLNLHVGLGVSDHIDSLIVYWPSGKVDHYYNLAADRKYLLNESSCLYDFSSSVPSKVFSFCKHIDTTFYADPKHNSVIWNNGVIGSKIDVHSEGVYFYSALDENKCLIISNPYSIIIDPVIGPRLNINYSKILCEGDSIVLNINEFDQVHWSNGEVSKKITAIESGTYFGTIQGYCKLEYSDTLHVLSFLMPAIPIIESDTLFGYKRALLKGNHEYIKWYEAKDSLRPIYSGKNFSTDSIFSSRSFWAEAFDIHSYNDVHGGPIAPTYESSPYHADFINNKMLFNVYKDLILDSVTVFTDFPGDRMIELFDAAGNLLDSILVSMGKGKTQIYLGFHIPASAKPYSLTTSIETNQKSLGTNSPKLYRSDKDFYYPFFIEDKLRILTSDKGDSYFYYFYDWVIREADKMCSSERIEVPVVLIPSDVKNSTKQNQWINIVNGNQIQFSGIEGNYFSFDIFNLDGKVIQKFQNVNTSMPLNISPLLPGIYFCRMMAKKGNQIIGSRLIVSL